MTGGNLTKGSMQNIRPLVVPALLLALAIVPVIAGIVRLVTLMTGQPAGDDARFFDRPLPVTIHILAVIPYSLLGALQFAPALRRRNWHRVGGMSLAPLGLIAALTGLWMTQFYPWPDNDGEAVYAMRLIVGVAMTWSIVRGIASLWRHEYVVHGAWMLRGYALGMGAGTQVLTHLPWFIFAGGIPGEGSRSVMMGMGWLINAVLAEYVIRRRFTARPSATSGRAHPMLPSTV